MRCESNFYHAPSFLNGKENCLVELEIFFRYVNLFAIRNAFFCPRRKSAFPYRKSADEKCTNGAFSHESDCIDVYDRNYVFFVLQRPLALDLQNHIYAGQQSRIIFADFKNCRSTTLRKVLRFDREFQLRFRITKVLC